MDTKPEEQPFIVSCPHCSQYIEILSISCGIFRHAVYKDSGLNINPHTPKIECDRLIKEGLVYGCALPFRIIDKKMPPETCEYI